jgi:hypothetical protein
LPSPQYLDAKLKAVKHHPSQTRALTIATKVKTAKLALFRDRLAILRQHAAIQDQSV